MRHPPQVQVLQRHARRFLLQGMTHLSHQRTIHFGIQQHTAQSRSSPFAQTPTSTAPATPINGSSQSAPHHLPPNSATMASTDVAASAST